MDECNWVSVCCNKKPHYWVDTMCSGCSNFPVAFECLDCQGDTHRIYQVGSLDCDPLSVNIMRAVGDMLKFYRGD